MPNSEALFDGLKDAASQAIIKHAQILHIKAGSTIFRQGDSSENYIIVRQGSVKVFTRAENGREIVLYRVQNGQSCTLTTGCLFSGNTYPAESVAETDVEALIIPRPVFLTRDYRHPAISGRWFSTTIANGSPR